MEPWEVQHKGLTECIVTDTMHTRKQIMAEKSDAVIALPGGWGTLDELFEILTWRQLGLHKMPVGILNINGFYDPMLVMLQKMVSEGFVKEANLKMVIVDDNIESLLEKLRNDVSEGVLVGKWLGRA